MLARECRGAAEGVSGCWPVGLVRVLVSPVRMCDSITRPKNRATDLHMLLECCICREELRLILFDQYRDSRAGCSERLGGEERPQGSSPRYKGGWRGCG